MTGRSKNRITRTVLAAFAAASGAAVVAALLGQAEGPSDCQAIGDKCNDGTVYVGSRQLKDRDGTALGDFNLFAAPADLTDDQGNRLLLTFNEAVKHIAGLKNYHGHDGGRFENDGALYEAIRDGRYGGEWFLPPRDILTESLYQNRNEGALHGTLETRIGFPFYWSSTNAGDITYSYVMDFRSGDGASVHRETPYVFTRAVRAEPRP